jgi:hypothetical protein
MPPASYETSRLPSAAGAGGYPGGAMKGRGYGPGGAGGGALLIASSTSITISRTIAANGGPSEGSHGGSGGSIRLVAPVINGSEDNSAPGAVNPYAVRGPIGNRPQDGIPPHNGIRT